MKLSLTVTTPEITEEVPVALLSGTFPERLRKASAFGCDGVELMVLDPAALDAAAIKSEIGTNGLDVAAVGTGAQLLLEGLTLVSDDPGIERDARARLHNLIDFASAVECCLVTIGSFRGRIGRGGKDAVKRLHSTLFKACETAERRGVRIVLEPLNRYETDYIMTAEEGMKLIEEIKHRCFGLLLDTFHMNIEEADISESLRTAYPRLWHIHIGDSNRFTPGKGHFDFSSLIMELKRLGYKGFLSAELFAAPDPDAAARETIEALRPKLKYLEEPV